MNSVQNDQRLLSLSDLVHRWSCSRSTAQRICERKKIPVFYLSGQPRGLIRFRLRDIEGDYYDLDEGNYCVRGRRSGHEIHLGDKVIIKVLETNLSRRTIDFELVEHVENPFDQFGKKKEKKKEKKKGE